MIGQVNSAGCNQLAEAFMAESDQKKDAIIEQFKREFPNLCGRLPLDVSFDVGGVVVQGSLLSLASRSHFFKKISSSSFKEGIALKAGRVFQITGISAEVFREYHHIFYTGTWAQLPHFKLQQLKELQGYLDFTGGLDSARELLKKEGPNVPSMHSPEEMKVHYLFCKKKLPLRGLKKYYLHKLLGLNQPEEAVKILVDMIPENLKFVSEKKLKRICQEWLLAKLVQNFDIFCNEFQNYRPLINKIKGDHAAKLTKEQLTWLLETISPLVEELNLANSKLSDVSILERFGNLRKVDIRGCEYLENPEELKSQIRIHGKPLIILR